MEAFSALATGVENVPMMPAISTSMVLGVLSIVLVAYLYRAFALMTIAQKTDTANAWLAFIPIVNIYLTWRVSRTPTWSILALAGIIAVTGSVALLTLTMLIYELAGWAILMIGVLILITFASSIGLIAIQSWWWWRIAEERGYAGGIGLLMTLPQAFGSWVPYIGMLTTIVPLVTIGVLAWRDPVTRDEPDEEL